MSIGNTVVSCGNGGGEAGDPAGSFSSESLGEL
jgi:hypothetical protein